MIAWIRLVFGFPKFVVVAVLRLMLNRGLTFLIGPPTNWQTLRDALAGPALEMMPVYRGWGTWASVVCGPAVVGIGTGNGQFGLRDDGGIGHHCAYKGARRLRYALRLPGKFLEAIGKDGVLGQRLACSSNRPRNRGLEGIVRCHHPVTADIINLHLNVHRGKFCSRG